MEVLVEKLGSELAVERSTVGHEGAGFSHITHEACLEGLELVGVGNPSLLVVLERVDETVGLVHLLPCLGRALLQSVLLRHLVVELLLKHSLEVLGLLELGFGGSKVGLGLLETGSLDLEKSQLRLHDL